MNCILNRKPRIIFDMDDVIVDYLGVLINDYNLKYATNYTIDDCKSWSLKDSFGANIEEFICPKGRFVDLPIKDDSVSYIKEIINSGRYDVFIATACPPHSYIEKYEWIREYMSFFNTNRLIPCTEKSAIWGDVIIDDKPSNIDEFIKNSPINSTGFLMDMPHNKNETKYNRICNLSNMLEILDNMFYK